MPDKTNGERAEVGFSPLTMPFGLEALVELNRPALAAMAQVNGKVYENLAAMNWSWADFLNRRLEKDLGMPQQLAACKSIRDVYGVYAEFFQAAVADYQGELEEMTKLGKTLADDALQAMQTRSEEPRSEARLN
jgi:phasin protein